MNPWTKRSTAFTLIELIVVVAIISILATIAVTRWPGSRINLNAQAQQLASDIRYTQTLSMSRAQDFQLNFLSSSSYSITANDGTPVNNIITGQTTTVLLATPATTITLPPTNLPNNLISFDSSGIPYTDSATTTALNSAAVITLTSGGQTTTITIQPQTGRITIP